MTEIVNSASAGMPGRVALVELHDSTVCGVAFQSGDVGVLSFAHMAVFFAQSVDKFDVWSCHCELLLEGVERFAFEGRLQSSDWVSDGQIVGVDGQAIELASAMEWTPANKVELVFVSSAKLLIRLSRVRLNLIHRREKLEEWTGPLRTSS